MSTIMAIIDKSFHGFNWHNCTKIKFDADVIYRDFAPNFPRAKISPNKVA